MPDVAPRAYAIKLLERDRARIAVAVARQLTALVPKYRTVPLASVEASTERVLSALARFVAGEGERHLLGELDRTFEARASEGYSSADLVIRTHAFLPVLRRFFCERSDDLRLGIAAYEEIEATCLGLMRHIVVLALEAQKSTDPGFRKKPSSSAPPWPPVPILVERVED